MICIQLVLFIVLFLFLFFQWLIYLYLHRKRRIWIPVLKRRVCLVYVFKNWKLLFKNIYGNTCGWKSALKYVKCCLKTENGCLKILTKHPKNSNTFLFSDLPVLFLVLFFFFFFSMINILVYSLWKKKKEEEEEDWTPILKRWNPNTFLFFYLIVFYCSFVLFILLS